jgi:hypothetical protein
MGVPILINHWMNQGTTRSSRILNRKLRMNRVNATGTVIRIPVIKMLRRRRFRLLNIVDKVGEWSLRY